MSIFKLLQSCQRGSIPQEHFLTSDPGALQVGFDYLLLYLTLFQVLFHLFSLHVALLRGAVLVDAF